MVSCGSHLYDSSSSYLFLQMNKLKFIAKSPLHFISEKIDTQRWGVTCQRPQSGKNGTGLGLGSPILSPERAHLSGPEMNFL